MKFLPVLKWMIGIILVVTTVAGGAGFYLLAEKDALVQAEILKKFSAVAPDLRIQIERTELDGVRAVDLHGLEIRDRKTSQLVFRAKSLRVDVDTNQLLDQHRVTIDRIRLSSADILLTRKQDGRWNWQEYTFQPPEKSSGPLPTIIVDDVAVALTLEHGHGIPPATLKLRDSRLQAVPSSAQSYDFDGAINLPGAGNLKLAGAWDLKSKDWSLGGSLRDIHADEKLMQLARATAPQIDGQLDQLDAAIDRALPVKVSGDNSTPKGAALQIGNNALVSPLFQGTIDVDFAVSGSPKTTVPQFKLLVNVKDGSISVPAVPFGLANVRAKFFKDNESLVFQLENAVSNDASIRGGFEMQTGPSATPGRGWFDIKRFPINEKLKPLLPERTLRLFNAFQPDIILSCKGEVAPTATGTWQPLNVTAEIHEGTTVYHKFRYPVRNLTGTINQRPYAAKAASQKESASKLNDVVFDVTLNGQLGPRSFRSTGWWKNPGPVTETRFEMSLSDFPLDSRFRNALGEKEQSVFDSLNLQGAADADFVFYRPPGRDKITQTFVNARIREATMKFRRFPYEIDNLFGHITYNSATKHWRFLDLKGQHGDGLLSAKGEFKGQTTPGELKMTISATGAALDADLYNALPKSQRSIWNMINPDGFCDLTAQVNWTAAPGQPPVVSFPEESPVRIYNTNIRPTPFPFDMKIQEAVLSFDPNDVRAAGAQHCEIHSFRATHGDAPITAQQCWAEAKPNGEWQLHLNHVNALNLQPDDQLRAALPTTWRQSLSRMHQVGRIAIRDSELDFRGAMNGDSNTTAGWDLNLQFRDCTLNAGLDVKHVYGGITARGAWDGYHLKNVGSIDIETAEVLDMPFTNVKGPYSLDDIELVLGSRRIFEPDSALKSVDRSNRMRALAYGGEVFIDALVDMRENGQYQFFTEVANAQLESYAALHIPDQQNLRGIVTAWMKLVGTGEEAKDVKGSGQLRISPAALYEIPVIVKLLGSLSQLDPNLQDRTAFNYALLNFNVENEAFDFQSIDLVGDSISFRGRGIVGFGGAVDLDFYSRPARSRAAAIPLISGLFTNWAKVDVNGTTDRPQVRVQSVGRIDEGLRQILQPPTPGAPIPGLTVPQFFQLSGPLRPRRPQNAAGARSQIRQ